MVCFLCTVLLPAHLAALTAWLSQWPPTLLGTLERWLYLSCFTRGCPWLLDCNTKWSFQWSQISVAFLFKASAVSSKIHMGYMKNCRFESAISQLDWVLQPKTKRETTGQIGPKIIFIFLLFIMGRKKKKSVLISFCSIRTMKSTE